MTLRRWHKAGSFSATFVSPGKRLYYSQADLQRKTKGLRQTALDWANAIVAQRLPGEWYCPTSDVFKARLERMTYDLLALPAHKDRASLIASAAGEIGNNSFDHNLGSFRDIAGVIFKGFEKEKPVVIADRGQGVRKTLERIVPNIKSDVEAIEIAFTKIISGRSPEQRGNGLKFVAAVCKQNNWELYCQSGRGVAQIINGTISFSEGTDEINGCLAVLKY